MNATRSVLAALALLCAPLQLPAQTAEPAPGRVTGGKVSVYPDWFKESFLDIGADVSEAADAGKHVILFLEMNGCPYCFKMNEENFKHAPYTDFIREHFEVIGINTKGDREVALDPDTTASEKDIARKLNVRYTPTLIFLSPENRPVARVNGYRDVEDFKLILDFVQARAYETQTLNAYLDARRTAATYAFRDHPRLEAITDLSRVTDRPLAVLFEDRACVACDALHDGHLADPEVNRALERMAFIRLDALADTPVVDPQGNPTTARGFAERLGITYRPSIVLFDRGREIVRIESMLYRYHFTGVLEYVAGRHYEQYPGGPFRYLDAKTAEILASGRDVSISE